MCTIPFVLTYHNKLVLLSEFRHLLDISWDFLFHMNVPKQFWSDVVLTACFLIHRMPSTMPDGASSLSNLFMSSPGLVDRNGNHSYQLSCPAKLSTVLLKSCTQSVKQFYWKLLNSFTQVLSTISQVFSNGNNNFQWDIHLSFLFNQSKLSDFLWWSNVSCLNTLKVQLPSFTLTRFS